MNKFCPIILCNIVYKIISKATGNRMSSIHEKLISNNQKGFVGGTKIMDVVITFY